MSSTILALPPELLEHVLRYLPMIDSGFQCLQRMEERGVEQPPPQVYALPCPQGVEALLAVETSHLFTAALDSRVEHRF